MAQKPHVTAVTFKLKKYSGGWLALVGVVLLAVVGAVLWYQEPWRHKSSTTNTAVPQQRLSNQAKMARLSVANGDPDAAIADIQTNLKQNLSSGQRVSLLEQEASAYRQKGDTEKAFAIYQQSEQLQQGKLDMATAQGLLSYYYDKGDKHMAAHYARLVIIAAKAAGDSNDVADIPQYQQLIRSLGEQP